MRKRHPGKIALSIQVDGIRRQPLLIFLLLVALFGSPAHAEKSKILYVNSYHKGYQWSDDIEKGLLKALRLEPFSEGGTANDQLDLRVIRMDTKRNPAETFIRQAALGVKAVISAWQPDVVVASDDNAAKHLIVPYYKDAATPFVFCGLNWDAATYGFPYSNVTGMVEVSPILEAIEVLKTFAKGDRLGYIGNDSMTNRKEIAYHQRILGIQYTDGELVSDYAHWRSVYLRLQDSVDILLLQNSENVAGWDRKRAVAFINTHTRIPTGSLGDPTVRFAMLGMVKIAEEQGWWAGKTALRILAGTPPAKIPIVRNQRSRVFLNMRLAARLGIKFPMALIEKATFVEELP
jgi:hypothetical protein